MRPANECRNARESEQPSRSTRSEGRRRTAFSDAGRRFAHAGLDRRRAAGPRRLAATEVCRANVRSLCSRSRRPRPLGRDEALPTTSGVRSRLQTRKH
jgi:hypothetical protein